MVGWDHCSSSLVSSESESRVLTESKKTKRTAIFRREHSSTKKGPSSFSPVLGRKPFQIPN